MLHDGHMYADINKGSGQVAHRQTSRDTRRSTGDAALPSMAALVEVFDSCFDPIERW